MRAKGLRIERVLLGLMLLLALVWNLAEAREVEAVSLRETATGTRAEIILDVRSEHRVLNLSAPERLVLDLPDTRLSQRLRLPQAVGVVKAVRSGQPEAGTARIVFDLAVPVIAIGPNLEWRDGKAVLILEWPGDGIAAIAAAANAQAAPPAAAAPQVQKASNAAASAPATTQAPGTAGSAATATASAATAGSTTQAAPAAASAAPVRSMQELNRKLRPIVVAIDAGHGGQDPGAVGPNGTREKDVTLAIARELARQVEATPGLKAYLTRDADFFIPLAERYQRARRAQADVFISIHADAAHNRSARGSSVYVLSTSGASSQAARWLADRENAADLVGGVRLKGTENTLASVLLDLSQSATQRASERMAGEVLAGLQQVGNTHKRQVERANFVVLRSPDVPSMLVETAFISNPEEEARLRDPAFQRRLARAVLNGIHSHFTRMPPPGTHYAARREASAAGSGGASP